LAFLFHPGDHVALWIESVEEHLVAVDFDMPGSPVKDAVLTGERQNFSIQDAFSQRWLIRRWID
jgi:hypothetical protein